MSLSLAYTMAGAGSIIQHMWKAPGKASSEIAVKYYSNRKWRKPENSLLKSKRIYLRRAKSGHDHPHYWAGIVYYGHRHTSNKKVVLLIIGIFLISILVFFIRKGNKMR